MGLNRKELSKRIGDLIKSGKEGKTWDFKRQWYEDKGKWVKHILAMANNETSEDSYIIIGVAEDSSEHRAERFVPTNHIEKDYKLEEDRKENGFEQQSELTKWLRELPFADKCPDLDLELGVWVSSLQCLVDLIIVRSTSDCPYYLSEDYPKRKCDKNKPNSIETEDIKQLICKENKKIDAQCIERINYSPKSKTKLRSIDAKNIEKLILKREPTESEVIRANDVYTRIKDMSAHTFNEGLAGFGELEKLYRKRFGLSLSIEDRFKLLLSDEDGWDYALYEQGCDPWDTRSMYVFHKHFPKFFIEMDFSDKRFSEQKIQPLPFLNEEDVDVCTCGLLKLFYDKFLIEKFCVYHYQISFGIQWLRVYFVKPLYIEVCGNWTKCTDEVKYIFYFFVKNDTGFNLNNILKKIFQNGEPSVDVTIRGVLDRSTYGLYHCLSPRFTPPCYHEALKKWEKLFKKNVIYFEDEEEKLEYLNFIEGNRKAICNELTSTTNAKNEREVNRFFVEHFHKWKFAKLLEEKNNWKIRVKKSLYPTCTLLKNTLYCNDFDLKDFPRLYNGLNEFACFFDEFKIIVICNTQLCYGAYFQNLEDHFYKFNPGLCVGVDGGDGGDGGEYNFSLISPNKNEHDDFPYLYIFKDSIEFKINDILLHAALTSSETSDIVKKCARECDEIFKNCVIYFENEEEKQKFDRYLQENRDDILEKINDFYKENCQEFEKNCMERVLKICPKEFSSSDVKDMVERGARAEKIAEFFRCWKNCKNNDNHGDLTSLVEDGAREVICLKGQK